MWQRHPRRWKRVLAVAAVLGVLPAVDARGDFVTLEVDVLLFDGTPGWDPGLTVFDVYAVFDDPGDILLAVFGDAANPLAMITTDPQGFWNSPFGNSLPPLDTLLDTFPELNWDTFVTIDITSYAGTIPVAFSPGFPPIEGGSVATSDGSWTNLTGPVAGPDLRIQIARLTVRDGFGVGGVVNLSLPGSQALGASFVGDPGAEETGRPLQPLIDAADPGEVIVLQPDVYAGPIDLLGKAITLTSTDPSDPDLVVVTGHGRDTVVSCISGEGPDTIIDGITMMSGSGDDGGGLRIVGSSPTIRNCQIIGSIAGRGGGVYVSGGTPCFDNCAILSNQTTDGENAFETYGDASQATPGGDGGGVYASDGAVLTMTGCTISGNSTGNGGIGGFHYFPGGKRGGHGGGIYADNASLTLVDSFVTSNTTGDGGRGDSAGSGGYGGGIHAGSSLSLTDTIVSGNCTGDGGDAKQVGNYGGGGTGGHGAGIYAGGSVTISACEISQNHAGRGGESILANRPVGGRGGGVFGGSLTVTGTMFDSNESGHSGNGKGYFEDFQEGGGAVYGSSGTLTGCSFTGNCANFGDGGAIWSFDSLSLDACTFQNNFAWDRGGALYVRPSSNVTLSGCSFDGNSAASGTGIFNRGTLFGYGAGVSGADQIINPGTIHAGQPDPGLEIGTFSLGMELIPGSATAGSLIVDLGGSTAGTGYDVIEFGAGVTFGGVLQVRLANGFDPPDDSTYEVVTGPAVSGQFGIVQMPGFADGRIMTVSYDAGPGGVAAGAAGVVVNVETFDFSTFGTGQLFGVPAGAPTDVVTAQFNPDEDDFLDLALTIFGASDTDAGSVVVLLNAGLDPLAQWQGFQSSLQFPAGIAPNALAADLLNGDGRPDIAVSNAGENTVWVLFNDLPIDGMFNLDTSYPVGSAPSDVAAAVFEGSAFVDLAVANNGSDSITILNNDGVGQFASTETLNLPNNTSPLAIDPTDIDDDRCLDIIASNGGNAFGDPPVAPSVAVLLASPGGLFDPPQFFPVGDRPIDVTCVDLDGDGDPDVATADVDSDTVSLFLNNGTFAGTWQGFAPTASFAVGTEPRSLARIDLDADSDEDLAVVVNDPGTVRVLRNDGNGVIAITDPVIPVGDAVLVTAGDVNNSGFEDLITIDAAPGAGVAGSGGSITVFLSNTCAADVNSDGEVDIDDLVQVIVQWGCMAPPGPCSADVTGDGEVDVDDLVAVVKGWGLCL